jgi:hypothetical protein
LLSLVTGSLPCTSLEPAVIPTVQATRFTLQYFPYYVCCSKYSLDVFCIESIECFPGIASRFFLELFVTISMAPVMTCITAHFRFHFRCISIPKLVYFNFYSAFFCKKLLSAGIATLMSVHVFSFLFLVLISGLFSGTSLSVCAD